jgi:glycosyltransferase involved in cell wall biosynthesis
MRRLGDSPLVVTVCQLRPEKNLPELLEAWARVRLSQPRARLAIVGDGTEMAGLKAQAERLGLGDSLLLPGNSPEPRAWYWAADIFVLSSSFEGLSNSLMEALCCGLAIVSTRVSGSEDIVEAADVGILVPVDDSAALGAALAELLADPDRVRASGLRAADYGAQHFSLESVSASVERLYAALVPTARSHSRPLPPH